MKRLFLVLVFLVAGFVILGFSRGWFHVASATAEDQSNVTVTVDKGKMQQDKDKATGKAKELGQEAKDKASTTIPKK
jgi:hypothetical protein